MPRYKVSSTNPVSTIDISQHMQTGDIKMAPSNDIPAGHLACEGGLVNIADYPQLYNYLTKNSTVTNPWGADVGAQFRLPDFRGVMPRGRANGSSNDPDRASRTAMGSGGATGDNAGSYQADEHISHNHGGGNHNHGVNGVGDHTHSIPAYDGLAGGGTYVPIAPTAFQKYISTTGAGAHSHSLVDSGTTISPNGGNETRAKNVYVVFVIKT